jgi:hypothetical protein
VLHGEVKINHHVIGTWRAVRQTPIINEYNKYDVTVEYTDIHGYNHKADFVHTHRFTDGALVLTGNLMLECVKHLRPYRPYDDLD